MNILHLYHFVLFIHILHFIMHYVVTEPTKQESSWQLWIGITV